MHDERAREAHALAHAAGQLLRIGVLETVETDEIDRRERALAPLGRRHASRLEPDLHILEHGEPGKQREGLEHHGDAFGAADDRRAAEGDAAGGRRMRPAIERSSVDLPEPERPRRPTISPSRKVISTPSRTTRSGVEPLW